MQNMQKKPKNATKRTASERQRTLIRLFGNTPPAFKLSSGVFSPLYWAFRRFHYWLCFYDNDVEIDVEDLLTNPFNTQPPSLDDLERLTGFRRDWIMFLYRNFKQICANGRMSQTQWRQIFRLIFKGASDYEFADRIFMAIAGNRSHPLITFEDLIFCLFDLIQSFRSGAATAAATAATAAATAAKRRKLRGGPSCSRDNSCVSSDEYSIEEAGAGGSGAALTAPPQPTRRRPSGAQFKMESAVPSTTTAQFTFSLMQPNASGLVDEAGFLRYTKCIFDLNASVTSSTLSGDMATFGMIQHMGSSGFGGGGFGSGGDGGGSGGRGGGGGGSQSSSSYSHEHSRLSKREKSNSSHHHQHPVVVPWQEAVARQQFRVLDADEDGFIQLADIQRLFDERAGYEPLVLHSESECAPAWAEGEAERVASARTQPSATADAADDGAQRGRPRRAGDDDLAHASRNGIAINVK